MTPPTDDELMARVREGEQRAFAELYERHRRVVFTFLLRLTGDRRTAEDLLQETFLRAWRSRGDYRASGQFRGWLFTIARRLTVDWYRREGLQWEGNEEKAVLLETLASPAGQPDRHAEAREELGHLQRALDRLPPAQRETILLSRFVGLDSQQIASVTNSTPGAVRVQLHRALAHLRAILSGP
ncbi:MAG: RNA polymerase sigma factor [Candidatus Rokubacteria bacterium]|nr:RNA polymerase sigma factor [Candidatus Rokubacteria bacterium]